MGLFGSGRSVERPNGDSNGGDQPVVATESNQEAQAEDKEERRQYGLNENQLKFCLEYTLGEHAGNGTRAYMAAYPTAKDYQGSAASASTLLKEPKVAQKIAELRKEAERAALESVSVQNWMELVPKAMKRLVYLMENAKSQTVQLQAAEKILDRALGKPKESHSVTVEHRAAVAEAAKNFASRIASATAERPLLFGARRIDDEPDLEIPLSE